MSLVPLLWEGTYPLQTNFTDCICTTKYSGVQANSIGEGKPLCFFASAEEQQRQRKVSGMSSQASLQRVFIRGRETDKKKKKSKDVYTFVALLHAVLKQTTSLLSFAVIFP